MQRAQIVQIPKIEGSDDQPQYVLTSADGQEMIIDAQALEASGAISGQLVQGATVQVVDGGQEVTYAYTTGVEGESIVTMEAGGATDATHMEIVESDGVTYATTAKASKTVRLSFILPEKSYQFE